MMSDYPGTLGVEMTVPGDGGNDVMTSEHRISGAVTGNGIDEVKVVVDHAIVGTDDDGTVKVSCYPGSTDQRDGGDGSVRFTPENVEESVTSEPEVSVEKVEKDPDSGEPVCIAWVRWSHCCPDEGDFAFEVSSTESADSVCAAVSGVNCTLSCHCTASLVGECEVAPL